MSPSFASLWGTPLNRILGPRALTRSYLYRPFNSKQEHSGMPRFQQIFHFLDRDASRRRSFALAAFLAVLLLTLSSAFFHITRSGAFDANLGGLLPNSLAPELSPALEERLKMRLAATGSTDLVATIGLNVKAFPKDQLPSKEVLDELLHQTAFVWVSVVLENAAISPVKIGRAHV